MKKTTFWSWFYGILTFMALYLSAVSYCEHAPMYFQFLFVGLGLFFAISFCLERDKAKNDEDDEEKTEKSLSDVVYNEETGGFEYK